MKKLYVIFVMLSILALTNISYAQNINTYKIIDTNGSIHTLNVEITESLYNHYVTITHSKSLNDLDEYVTPETVHGARPVCRVLTGGARDWLSS